MPNNYSVLLVEDDEFLAELYSTKLTMEGFTVQVANDGEKGLKMALAKPPQLILLDIVMPKMDGFEVLAALKKDASTKDVPVVLMTNLSQRDDVTKGLALGATDYLIKAHFMPSEVVKKINEVLTKFYGTTA
jgi:DNA-binding response OmpR family regulator